MCYRTADCFLFTLIWKNSLQSATLKHILDTPILRSYLFSDYQQWHLMQEKTDTSFIHGSDSPGNVLLRNIEVRFIFTLSRGQGFCPPLIFNLISSRGASCGCWEGAPSYPQHADGRLWMSKIFPDFEIQRARAGILPPSAIFNSRCDTWKFKVRETLKFEEETISNSCSRLHEKLPPNL